MRALYLALIGLTLACGTASAAAKIEQAEYRYSIGFVGSASAYTWGVYCDKHSDTLFYVSEYAPREIVYAGPCR